MQTHPEQMPLLARNISLLLQSLNIKFDQNVLPLTLEYVHKWITTLLLDAYQISSDNNITVDDIKQTITSRVQWEFIPVPSRTMFAKLADQLNSKPLPMVKDVSGLRLPDDNDCLVYSSFKTIPMQQIELQNPYNQIDADKMELDSEDELQPMPVEMKQATSSTRLDIRDEDEDYD
eukprot:NODE_535_length_7046_cov_0.230747.p5 type:complete len:176 gc:universal NODE_535_length_7046_cov_0.230747:4487-5014(+)